MRTGYLAETGRVEVRELAIPSIGRDEVLIRVKVAGICGSDVHAYHGAHPFRKAPMVLGHEVAGEVVEIGHAVAHVKVGDRVTVEPLRNCGTCAYCLERNYNICSSRVSAGTGGWLGSFAEFFAAPADKVHILPDSLDYHLGMLVESLAVGVHAVKLSRLRQGENALVIGTGPIGLLAAVAAQAAGAGNVVCTDLNDFRLDIAEGLGLRTVHVARDSIREKTKDLAPDGFAVVLVTVTSGEAVDQALRMVRRGGRVIIIPIFTSHVSFDIGAVQLNEIEVKGSMIYTKEDFQTALKILVERGQELRQVVTHSIGLDEIGEAIEMLAARDNRALKIAVRP